MQYGYHCGVLTFAFMAATIAVLPFVFGLFVVLLAHFLAERLRANPAASRLMTRLAGMLLIDFGIRLGGRAVQQ